MAGQQAARRLVAILAADMAGFSRLMEQDEAGTIARLKACRAEIIDPALAMHQGRIFKTMGDGLLAELPSVVGAVECALAIQRAVAGRYADLPEGARLAFRIGVNLGEIVIDGDDALGDSINVAARLQALAAPGEICISAKVYEELAGKLRIDCEDLGECRLKNISRPVRAFCVRAGAAAGGPGSLDFLDAVRNKPAVAVLPFVNLGDPDQEYFSDGLAEDIIMLLSAWRSFPVIARNSSFAYKDRSPDVRRIGRELSAHYLIQGSVRRSGNRLRIAVQLVDTQAGHQLWADKFDGTLDDVFEMQDDITRRIVAVVEPELEKAEIRRAATRRTANLGAWDYFLRGRAELHKYTPEANARAHAMFEKAIALDPHFGDAHAGLSLTWQADILLEVAPDRKHCEAEALRLAHRAVDLDDDSAFAHYSLGGAFIWSNQHEASIAETRLALRLNPSDTHACLALGNRLDIMGQGEEGIPLMERALRLNPRDPTNPIYLVSLARAHINGRNYEEGLALLGEATRRNPDLPHAWHMIAIALGHLGRAEEARAAAERCDALHPGFIGRRADWNIYVDPAANRHLADGLKKAGI